VRTTSLVPLITDPICNANGFAERSAHKSLLHPTLSTSPTSPFGHSSRICVTSRFGKIYR